MKILIYCRNKGEKKVWTEELVIPEDSDPYNYAQRLVLDFNETLRKGEKERELVGVNVLELDVFPHEWEKTSLVSQHDGNLIYDNYRCKSCGITARRYGIGGPIIRDKKWAAKKYYHCRGEQK